MKFYLGVTDNHWFNFLSKNDPEDVNFWQPGGSTSFKALQAGAPFLFKLKHPLNAISGIGFFSSHTTLPLSIAWEAFGSRNGCQTYEEFKTKIISYRSDKNNHNPNIGCIILTNPIFFEKHDWIETPSNWSKNIVQGKVYSTEDFIGQELWNRIHQLLEKYLHSSLFDEGKNQLTLEEPVSPIYGSTILTKVRLGQGAFRILITDAYSRRCSITGEKTLPVLEAAHIKPYAESGPHFISNGILLRADIHKLFDFGYLTITSNLKIEVSQRIKEEYENGKEYYQYHGRSLNFLPERDLDKPNPKYIEWHNAYIYKG